MQKNDPDDWQDFFHEANQPLQLSKNQKISVGLLVTFGVFIFVFWAVDIRRRMEKPFIHGDGQPVALTDGTDSTQADVEALKKKDTDLDGLNDYDETYIYKTSPYLEDSDGDSVLDKAEVAAGTDPNCPTGKDCGVTTPNVASSSQATDLRQNNIASSSVNQNINQAMNGLAEGTQTNTSTGTLIANKDELLKAVNGQADAVSLRKMLISSGMPMEALDKISDAELLANYKEVLAK